MLLKKYNSIMEKSDAERSGWALGLAVTLSLFIFVSFAFYKGYLTFGESNPTVAKEENTKQTATVALAPSPFESSKETLKDAFGEIAKQYSEFKDSVSAVLVPFVTGIDVYERE